MSEDFPDATPRPWYFDGWDIFTSADSAGPRGDGHRLVVPLSHLNETFHPSQKVSEDDARLIVAAVNERDTLAAKIVEQADRIAWLEGEVAGWRIKLAETIEDAERYRDALEKVAETDGGEWFARSVARAALDGTRIKLAECEERHG